MGVALEFVHILVHVPKLSMIFLKTIILIFCVPMIKPQVSKFKARTLGLSQIHILLLLIFDVFWAMPCGNQELLLALHSEIMPGSL